MKRRDLMKLSAALAVTLLGVGPASRVQNSGDQLERGFLEPPNTAKPRAWWFLGDGNVTQEGIKKDLEWMKRVGFGGFMRADFAMRTPQIVKRVNYMSPKWMDDFKYTTELADRLGFQMGTSATPGWSASGGPWVPPSQGMKKFVWTETRVEGGKPFRGKLAHPPTEIGPFQNLDLRNAPGNAELELPDPWYADAAVVAYRLPDNDESMAELQPKVTSSGGNFDLATLTDGDYANGTLLPPAPVGKKSWIQFEFQQPITVRGLSIYSGDLNRGMLTMPGQSSGQTLEVSDDGQQYRVVAELPGLRLPSFVHEYSVGACTISFAPATAKFFRIAILAGKMGPVAPQATNISQLALRTSGWVNRLEEKTATFSTPSGIYEMTTPAVAGDAVVHKGAVIDLTSKMAPDGILSWTPPAGKWAVLRLGYSLVGTMNRGTTPEATGLEVDKLSKSAVKSYYDYYLGKFERATGGLMGKRGLNYLHNDNWERGQANWTDEMITEFTKRRGYDMKAWLPVLVGHVVGSAEASDRFLWDFRKTIAEMTAEYTYDQLSDILNQHGMGRYSQGHEFSRQYVVDGMDVKRCATVPMGVAWAGNPAGEESLHNEDLRETASVAHIYGQNLAVAETFPANSGGEEGEEGKGSNAFAFSPERLKPAADAAFADGVNRIDYEACTHQPVDDKVPGLAWVYGQWFTRHETWAEYAKPWITYLARSSHMLQQGRAVADVLYYYGEDSNITALFDDTGPDVPEGYALDYASSDVVLNRIGVTNGCITTSSGVSYRLLVLDDNAVHMPLNVLKKIGQLVNAGAIVVGPKPTDSPSNSDNQAEFKSIADQLWGPGKGARKVGKGQVFAGRSAADALRALKVAPDFEHTKPQSDTSVAHVHRKISDGDIYFVHNRKNRAENVEVTFRVAGKAPELWDAVTGEIKPAAYSVANERTTVPLNLHPAGSVFVVFRKPGSAQGSTLPRVTETPVGTIGGSWTVAFQPNRGAPASVTLNRLSAWNEHSDPGVKYFSGTATYTKTIQAPAKWFATGARMMLDLGSVKNIAEVTVNGTSTGVLWTPPFLADVTGALKPGSNTLKIAVTNLWPNRLIGDLQPNTVKKYTWTSLNTLRADSPLLPSGLLGPVRILRRSSN